MNSIEHRRPRGVLLRIVVGLGLGLAVGGGASCTVQSIFTCTTNEDCVGEGGEGWVCQSNSQCTLPDLSCDSGMRWHDRAVEELAGQCFDPADLGGSGSATDASSGGSSTGEGSTGDPGSTTLPSNETDDDPDSTGTPPMTDGGSSSSGGGGGARACDAQFGAVDGYELCEFSADSCSFNAITGGGSCNDICGANGSACVTAFNNSAGDCASMKAESTCEETANDQICVCSLP